MSEEKLPTSEFYHEQMERILAVLPLDVVEKLKAMQLPTEEEAVRATIGRAIILINQQVLMQGPPRTPGEKGGDMLATAKRISQDLKLELGGTNFALAAVYLAGRILATEIGEEAAMRVAKAVDQLAIATKEQSELS